MDNHFTVEGKYLGYFINKDGVHCIKLLNQYKGTEFDRPLDWVNKYFTVKITSKRDIEKLDYLDYGKVVLIDGHLKQEIKVDTERAKDSFKLSLFCDGIFEMGA